MALGADAARSERLSMDRTGADVFTRTQSLQPVPSPPRSVPPASWIICASGLWALSVARGGACRRLKELSRKPSLPLPYAAHSPSTRMLLVRTLPPLSGPA